MGGSDGKASAYNAEDPAWIPGSRRSFGEGTYSSTLAYKIPWTEERGRLQSMGLQRVGHDWATSLSRSTTSGVQAPTNLHWCWLSCWSRLLGAPALLDVNQSPGRKQGGCVGAGRLGFQHAEQQLFAKQSGRRVHFCLFCFKQQSFISYLSEV